MSSSSESSVSSLTSNSTIEEQKSNLGKMTSKISDSPAAQILLLNKLHDRMKRKRKLRKIKKKINFIINYMLPTFCILFSVCSLMLWHFLRYRELLIAGTLGLLTTIGCLLQMCFWKRSLPNKFSKNDIPFHMNDEQQISKDNCDKDTFDAATKRQTVEVQLPNKHKLSLKPCLVNGSDIRRTSFMITKDSSQEDERYDSEARRDSKQSVSIHVQPMVLGVDQLQVRRLSMALNKATQELTQVRKMREEGSMMHLARRLTLAGSTFDNDRSFHGGGNNWLGGRVGRGVRSGLAWNETGAGRFFARNYD